MVIFDRAKAVVFTGEAQGWDGRSSLPRLQHPSATNQIDYRPLFMPRLQRRSKVISIRLSREEYDQFQDLCIARGSDTISELARTAMKLLAQTGNGNADGRFSALEALITHLE